MFKEDPAWGELAMEHIDEWITQAEILDEVCIQLRVARHPQAFAAGVHILAAHYAETFAEESTERQRGNEATGSVSSV